MPSHWGFFPGHQTVPCALESTQPLKMSMFESFLTNKHSFYRHFRQYQLSQLFLKPQHSGFQRHSGKTLNKVFTPCFLIPIVQPTRCTCYLKLFIIVKRSTCFGRSLLPSSGAQNCVDSNGICQTAAATCCYSSR